MIHDVLNLIPLQVRLKSLSFHRIGKVPVIPEAVILHKKFHIQISQDSGAFRNQFLYLFSVTVIISLFYLP